ncbi:MAG TPA: maleylpyruvate isomerase family mycothiol-dependent enzyme [Jatrophihabitans sp.]|nr:maleylpyruvate isomerase family mycothiol-dependent enzyme [Jatrophihabitans sp.]
MGSWDATTYEGKDTILRVVRDEAAKLFDLVADSDTWDRTTACARWTTRDVVGHLVDTTEGYFAAFDAARGHRDTDAEFSLPVMSQVAGDRAIAFRASTQPEMLERLRTDFDKCMELLDGIGPDDWTGMMVTHAYMGRLPAYFYAAGQLMDYAVHSWDIREGAGREHAMSGEAADLLVPFMFVLWQSTLKPDSDLSPFEIGVRVFGGHNAGETRVSISPEGMSYAPGNLDDLPCVLEFDAAGMVLTTFGRCRAGTVRGDQELAERFLNLFYRI